MSCFVGKGQKVFEWYKLLNGNLGTRAHQREIATKVEARRPPVLCDAAATLVVNQEERGEELSGFTGSSCRSPQDHHHLGKRDAGWACMHFDVDGRDGADS